MSITETQIWERLSTNKPFLIENEWLGEVYSLTISKELRYIIGERLGVSGSDGWGIINQLIKKHGPQYELIIAAGLCHQTEAKDFLLSLLKQQQKPEINTVKALSCWGAILPVNELKRIFNEKSLDMRLAGLNLLNFKVHLLHETELLELVEDLLEDFREEVVIQVIKILQRRDEEKIIDRISKSTSSGTEKTIEIALIALGAIGTKYSFLKLSQLSLELRDLNHRAMAKKQLSHQCSNLNRF